MVCMCILVYSCFSKNPLTRSYLTTHLSRRGVTTWYQSRVEVKCMLMSLKNDQQHFYGEERILPT
jgi:hypothetical protein